MRRFVVSIVVILTGLAGAAAPSSAAVKPSTLQKRVVNGPFTGTSAYALYANSCTFAFQTYDLSFQTNRNESGTIHVEGCVSLMSEVTGGFGFENGTFTLVGDKGLALTGIVSGGTIPLDLTLTVADATKKSHDQTSSIAVVGTGGPSGDVRGILTGSR